MKRELITSGALVAMAALVMFSGVAEGEIIINGVTRSEPRITDGVYNLSNSGVNTIDGGSLWTHNQGTGASCLIKIGNQSTAGTLTVSGGGYLDITGVTNDGNYTFQVGNKALGTVVITGAGSTVNSNEHTAIGRYSSAGPAYYAWGSTLTIDDGGLLMSEVVRIGRDANSASCELRMGAGGILAIEGTGKTATSQLWNTNQTGTGNMMSYNPSGDGTTWLDITGATAGVDYTLADGTDDLAGYSVLTMAEPATDVPGDADRSGFVDDDDLAVLLSNWEQDPGTITTWALGDFTADTDVDDDDLAVLLGNWTGPGPAGAAAVPEPTTLALLGLGGLAALQRRRK